MQGNYYDAVTASAEKRYSPKHSVPGTKSRCVNAIAPMIHHAPRRALHERSMDQHLVALTEGLGAIEHAPHRERPRDIPTEQRLVEGTGVRKRHLRATSGCLSGRGADVSCPSAMESRGERSFERTRARMCMCLCGCVYLHASR